MLMASFNIFSSQNNYYMVLLITVLKHLISLHWVVFLFVLLLFLTMEYNSGQEFSLGGKKLRNNKVNGVRMGKEANTISFKH